MAIVINGSGTVTGISVGGLPDGIVDSGTLATNSVDSAELIDGSIDNSHIDAMAASKLTGSLPAISGASLTDLPIQMEEDYWTFDMSSATGTTVHTITASFTPKLAWLTYNDNATNIGMVTGWLNDSGGAGGSQNPGNAAAGYYTQGNGMFQCGGTGGRQHIDMTASASGQYTISNTPNGSPSGTGYFSLILFGN